MNDDAKTLEERQVIAAERAAIALERLADYFESRSIGRMTGGGPR